MQQFVNPPEYGQDITSMVLQSSGAVMSYEVAGKVPSPLLCFLTSWRMYSKTWLISLVLPSTRAACDARASGAQCAVLCVGSHTDADMRTAAYTWSSMATAFVVACRKMAPAAGYPS